ncbi:hypothetical protein AYO49_01680 [Verrucomicrobiaceae bacterium SCGC AG-212-N21]|nr:hypothetical protein AYO49_01680 [Verrucomicrobiaceae bacterium SCGC AG-212-N21]
MFTMALCAAEPAVNKAWPNGQTASGTFVSFKDGILTLRGKSGEVHYPQVGANYQTFENNEAGPGSKQVDTVAALSRVVPGTVFRVQAKDREIYFGLDDRVIGTFESYEDGTLNLLPAEVPPGFIRKPAGKVALTVETSVPVLESIKGGDYQYAGPAGEVLKTVKPGTLLTARSEFDMDLVEVIQMGDPKRTIERYIGQTRGTVRGALVSFKDGMLRIRGKGVTSLAANEYERLITLRINDDTPMVESIDGGAYERAGIDALKTAKEGAIVTIRRVEAVVLEVQIGVAKNHPASAVPLPSSIQSPSR